MITILEQFRNLQFGNKLHFRLKKKTYYFLFISISILEILKRWWWQLQCKSAHIQNDKIYFTKLSRIVVTFLNMSIINSTCI